MQLQSALLSHKREKVECNCFMLEEQYSKLMYNIKASAVYCTDMAKDDLSTVAIPNDFEEIHNSRNSEY